MKYLIYILLSCFGSLALQAQITIEEVSSLPVRVSNNAVCEGFIGDTAYVFSFSGIDSTKSHSGIHLKSYRYNTLSGACIQIPNLPDTMGKIATVASRIDSIIYISGGYHVLPDGSELSSNKLHRYDIQNNVFLSDAADIPMATDDHVQVVWRDSLIYLITGWSNTGNIPDVQIYNPSLDAWSVGTSVPNNNSYKSFGSSGLIVNDTIYYFGGASSGSGFPAQSMFRKGIINPDDPSAINWAISIPSFDTYGYRMASAVFNEKLYWIGGSSVTYNYDGIAYNGSGGVPPNNRILWTEMDDISWQEEILSQIPMDLRGQAKVNDSTLFIAGGMLSNQTVSNKIFKLTFSQMNTAIVPEIKEFSDFKVYPNPFTDQITIESSMNQDLSQDVGQASIVKLFDSRGHPVLNMNFNGKIQAYRLNALPKGLYVLQLIDGAVVYQQKVMKLH